MAEITRSGSTLVAQHRFHFNRNLIEKLPSPQNGQRAYYYDTKVRGLALAVSTGGKKVFVLYRKVDGRPERITIGPFIDMSIEAARERAEEFNAAIARGQNPAADKRKVRDEMTLGELFDLFLSEYAKEKKRTWREDEAMFKRHLHGLRLRRISAITRFDVIRLHATIGRKHPYAANRVIELLCAMYNRARSDWGWTGANPAADIKAFKERRRKRFLDGKELPAFFKALATEPNETVRDYVLVSLLTGARRSNVQAMEWVELDWKRAIWKIPAAKAKSGEDIEIALSRVAIGILKHRKADAKAAAEEDGTELGAWVFPGSGKTGHLVSPKTAWKRILNRAKLTDLRLHDLRRTLGSWQAAMGSSLPIIGRSLGHESLEATKIYARLNLDPVRQSVNRATHAMLMAGGQRVAGLLTGKTEEGR